MNSSKTISSSILVLLILVIMMTLIGVRGFMKLAPSTELVNSRNVESLYSAEIMLSDIAINNDLASFELALQGAKYNITEDGEAEIIQNIEKNYKSAFLGSQKSKNQVIRDIKIVSDINRSAIKDAVIKTQQLSSLGAWVMTFMGIFTCLLGLILYNALKKKVIAPLDELKNVFSSFASGNKLRRCPTIAPTKDFQQIYEGLNSLLDKIGFK